MEGSTKFAATFAGHVDAPAVLFNGERTLGTGLGVQLHPGLVVINFTLFLHALLFCVPFPACVSIVPLKERARENNC